MTRKKKDVKEEDIKVQVSVFAFDLLFLNDEAVVKKSLRERRELLHSAFTPIEGQFGFATCMDGREIDEIQTFLDESVKASCEGLMVKMLDGAESGYEPSKRSRNWLKVRTALHQQHHATNFYRRSKRTICLALVIHWIWSSLVHTMARASVHPCTAPSS
jgi:ATP-dependent DNA ligase